MSDHSSEGPSALVVAIDGPAGVGKSTVARRLADDLGWAYLDTGALYRAVALVALELGVRPDDAQAVAEIAVRHVPLLDARGRVRVLGRDVTEEIRGGEVTRAVPHVAASAALRRVMIGYQRAFATTHGRVVAEGRDMGTVVFPDALVKVYLDASAVVRARRRADQDAAREGGATPPDVAEVLERIEDRDHRDRSRAASPLRPARAAWRLDTSAMTQDEVVAAVRSHVRSRIPVGPEQRSGS